MFRETGQGLSRDSQRVVRYVGNDTFLARRSPGFLTAIMSFPEPKS